METNFQIREIHVDGDEVGQEFLRRIEELGFFKDNFVGRGNGMKPIPYHWTWQVIGPQREVAARQEIVYRELVTIAKEEPFRGYIETEVIDLRNGHQIAIPWRTYNPDILFPLREPLQLVRPDPPDHKIADIHCKVPIADLHAMLEERMRVHNVSYVDTPKGNRIYTMQLLDKIDALASFHTFTLYFMKAGAATEITYEVCPDFFRQPQDTEVPPCVAKGSLSYLAAPQS